MCKLTFSIGLCASLYEPYGVFDELPAGLNKLHYLIHGLWAADKTNALAVDGLGPLSVLTLALAA